MAQHFFIGLTLRRQDNLFWMPKVVNVPYDAVVIRLKWLHIKLSLYFFDCAIIVTSDISMRFYFYKQPKFIN